MKFGTFLKDEIDFKQVHFKPTAIISRKTKIKILNKNLVCKTRQNK